MKIPNYGEWAGDKKGGHHPPACTCFQCNEQRNKETAAELAAELELPRSRDWAEGRSRADVRRDQRQTAPVCNLSPQPGSFTQDTPSDCQWSIPQPSQNEPPRVPPPVSPVAGREGPGRRRKSPLVILLWVALLGVIVGLVVIALYVSASGIFAPPQGEGPVAVVPPPTPTEEPTPEPTPESTQVPTPEPPEPNETATERRLVASSSAVVPTPMPTHTKMMLTPTPNFTPTPDPTFTPTPDPAPTRATPMPTRTPVPKPTATPRPHWRQLDPVLIGELVIAYLNEERERRGLHALLHDPAISEIAQAHIEASAATGRISHDIGGKGPTDRARAAGYNCRAYSSDGSSYSEGLAENLAMHPVVRRWRGNPGSWRPVIYHEEENSMAEALHEQWMGSLKGHRETMLKAVYRRVGVGVTVVNEVLSIVEEPQPVVYAAVNFSRCG